MIIHTRTAILTYILFSITTTYIQGQSVLPFRPEIFSRFPSVRDLTISSDANEMYFTGQSILGELSVILRATSNNSKADSIEVASFSGTWTDMEPFMTPDGLRLYFVSNRPSAPDSLSAKDFDIWYVERKKIHDDWGEPVCLESPVNTSADEFFPIVTKSNNIYFTSDRQGTTGKDDIFYAQWQNGGYSSAQPLPGEANSAGYEFNAWVTQDESYMIYTCYNRAGGLGSGDLYISKNKEGIWTAPVSLGAGINSKQMDYCPFIFNDILYFTSKRSNVKTFFEVKPDLSQVLSELNKYDNGSSRIYSVKVSRIGVE